MLYTNRERVSYNLKLGKLDANGSASNLDQAVVLHGSLHCSYCMMLKAAQEIKLVLLVDYMENIHKTLDSDNVTIKSSHQSMHVLGNSDIKNRAHNQ